MINPFADSDQTADRQPDFAHDWNRPQNGVTDPQSSKYFATTLGGGFPPRFRQIGSSIPRCRFTT